MPDHRMRLVLLLTIVTSMASCRSSGTGTPPTSVPATMHNEYVSTVVEAACGECRFGLPGAGCDLAVRIDGNAYFVDGTGIDDHGDAHASQGFCNAVRQARVTGQVIDSRFAAQSFELLPAATE